MALERAPVRAPTPRCQLCWHGLTESCAICDLHSQRYFIDRHLCDDLGAFTMTSKTVAAGPYASQVCVDHSDDHVQIRLH
jgi:hypothetical protein